MSAPTYLNAEQRQGAEIAASVHRLANMLQRNPTLALALAPELATIEAAVPAAQARIVLDQARLAGAVHADKVTVEHDLGEIVVTLAFGRHVRVGYGSATWNLPMGYIDLDPANCAVPDEREQVPA